MHRTDLTPNSYKVLTIAKGDGDLIRSKGVNNAEREGGNMSDLAKRAQALMEAIETDEAFKSALHIYSIDNLNMLANIARGCLDVLIQHGQATPEADMYEQMYLKYYNKSEYIQKELRDREAEAAILRRVSLVITFSVTGDIMPTVRLIKTLY